MIKKLISALTAVILILGLVAASERYYYFISRTIYKESIAHLTEIYHQANRSLFSLVGRNWHYMHMWPAYLQSTDDEQLIEEYITLAKDEVGFTDFYFISRDGRYRTLNDETGYLDFKENLPKLILESKDVVVTSVVSGHPQIIVFAVPAGHGSYKGFEYEAIAISFNNSDLVETLETSAFNGQSDSYVIRPDGRVVVDNAAGSGRNIYNFLSMLRDQSDLTEPEVDAIQQDFLNSRSGATVFRMENTSYYLIYEPVEFDNWIVLGIVPTSVVNSSMNSLQSSTILMMAVVAAVLIAALVIFLLGRYRRSLSKKDAEILYREELFSTLSSNVDDIFAMLDGKSLRVDYISPNVEKLIGIPEARVRDNIRMVDCLVSDSEKGLILDKLPDILPGEQAEWDREYIHQQTQKPRWFHATALCRKIRGEKKYILVLSDRTKDKQINQELEAAVNMARSANKAKSTFLSNMSHDIRTPMNAIIGFTTLAIANMDNSEKVRDYMTKILSSSNHLLSLLNDILDMSRIESGKIQLEETEANLSEMLHDIRNIISGHIHAKQLELYMDITEATNEDVYCDKTRINQVLLNLLSNAIKFTAPGGTISVRVSQINNADNEKGMFEISVKDTGIGMSEDFAERIFEPFERERTSTVSKIQGTGLGMAISKNIIDMMGGSIEVRTEQGKGTEYIIKLTLRLQPEHKSEGKIAELEGHKALVVDDDLSTCDSVTKMLARVGMCSERAMVGKDAVLRAKQSIEKNDAFQVYIIDRRLPDMNGIEAARQIRSLGDSTPIILLSAYDWSDIEAEARTAGVTAFCSKPMFLSDLRESLLSALGQKELKKETVLPAYDESDNFRGKHLLLVEDNDLNREIVYEILKEYGFRIDTAVNGREALNMVSSSAPGEYDLVLMDIQMPVMDGYEATRRIRALDDAVLSEIPIVAMTANAFDEDRRTAEACGMDGFISKPINMDDVIRVLRSIFEK
ncbi:MAG: response regulator [Oscillospiraceae bacterium]|nr:response regulator [Oscillospiraceae bacterium]